MVQKYFHVLSQTQAESVTFRETFLRKRVEEICGVSGNETVEGGRFRNGSTWRIRV